MPEQKTAPPAPTVIENIPVNLIGVRTEGTGAPISDGQVIVTPDHQPNIVTRVIPPAMALLVRFINLFLTTLVGFITLKMAPSSDNMVIQAIQAIDFYHLVMAGASVSLSAGLYGFLKDLLTIFGRLERDHPLLTGSI